MSRERDLASRFLRELFPFNIVLDISDRPRIVSMGPSLSEWIGATQNSQCFFERFSIVRPNVESLTFESISKNLREVFVLDLGGDERQLRGQFFLAEDGLAVFVGSPVVNTATSIDALGLNIADFAPHDSTPDIMVLGRFAQMQIKDLERQTDELRRALEARDTFSERASTDSLTELPNRRSFWERCEERVTLASSGASMALLYIDVDHFKAINDEHGHQAGDTVLQEIARRLSTALRPSDVSARLGGDEFAALLLDIGYEDKEATVERIRQGLSAPVAFEELSLDVSVSIGARMLSGSMSLDEFLRDADTAMYHGRGTGRGQVTWFETEMGTERTERRVLTSDLRAGLTTGRLHPMFQPIVRLVDRKVVALESLARWTHPKRGPIGPDLFVSLAESAGFVDQIDDAIMQQSLGHLAAWHTTEPGLGLQINVSGRSIDKSLPDRVRQALEANGISPSALTIEVTEGWFIDGDEAIGVLNEIAQIGVQVHLDDFGTGFSSMAHLQAFPISGLKIDRSFVAEMTKSRRSRKLVAATISMARSLELEVVAEGVESETEANMLRELGCHYAQGYLYARPLSVDDATVMIKSPLLERQPD